VCRTTNVNNGRDNGNSFASGLVSLFFDKPECHSEDYEGCGNDDDARGNGAGGQGCVKLDDQMYYFAPKTARTVGHVWGRTGGERV
jgi:hypothetical protein